MSERIEVEGNLPEWNYTDMTIFNTQPTCGELSCEECNERYEKAVERIAALEAERDKAVELLRTECLCYEFSAACSRCKQKHVFLASIGGEEKP